MNRFKSIVDQLFRFYNFSPVRTAGLAEIRPLARDPSAHLEDGQTCYDNGYYKKKTFFFLQDEIFS